MLAFVRPAYFPGSGAAARGENSRTRLNTLPMPKFMETPRIARGGVPRSGRIQRLPVNPAANADPTREMCGVSPAFLS